MWKGGGTARDFKDATRSRHRKENQKGQKGELIRSKKYKKKIFFRQDKEDGGGGYSFLNGLREKENHPPPTKRGAYEGSLQIRVLRGVPRSGVGQFIGGGSSCGLALSVETEAQKMAAALDCFEKKQKT